MVERISLFVSKENKTVDFDINYKARVLPEVNRTGEYCDVVILECERVDTKEKLSQKELYQLVNKEHLNNVIWNLIEFREFMNGGLRY